MYSKKCLVLETLYNKLRCKIAICHLKDTVIIRYIRCWRSVDRKYGAALNMISCRMIAKL